MLAIELIFIVCNLCRGFYLLGNDMGSLQGQTATIWGSYILTLNPEH